LQYRHEIINSCSTIWSTACIGWDGEFMVCCVDAENKYKIGNVQNNSVINLWKSKAFMNFRQSILKNKKQHEMCCICLNNGLPIFKRNEPVKKSYKLYVNRSKK
jgi:radical SAM protein with 4Fe4S-binding SPASM domain